MTEEICKCGKAMELESKNTDDDLTTWVYVCNKCGKKHLFQFCECCEHLEDWWEDE